MNSSQNLDENKVCVVGLGYVGLTLGVALAKKGIKVFGAEKNIEIIDCLRKNKAHFSEKGLNEIIKKTIENQTLEFGEKIPEKGNFSTYIITVGTPLDKEGSPRKDMIKSATSEVAEKMSNGSLVILRSTVELGSTRDVVLPILKDSGKDFDLAMCPERTLEGDAINELGKLPQIIGADSENVAERCARLFSNLTSKTISTNNFETAEMIKLVDNTSRDLYFSFANEVAEICNSYSIDVYEVIEKGQSEYPRTKMSFPGPVGGPCLEKDPHILAISSEKKGFTPQIIKAGRNMNESQIDIIVERLRKILEQSKIDAPKILLCGLAFKGKPETDDLRGSMGLDFLKKIGQKYENLYLYDPIVTKKDLENYSQKIIDLEKTKEKFDLVVILNNHHKFSSIEWSLYDSLLNKSGFVFDFWNSLSSFADDQKYFHLGTLHKRL